MCLYVGSLDEAQVKVSLEDLLNVDKQGQLISSLLQCCSHWVKLMFFFSFPFLVGWLFIVLTLNILCYC